MTGRCRNAWQSARPDHAVTLAESALPSDFEQTATLYAVLPKPVPPSGAAAGRVPRGRSARGERLAAKPLYARRANSIRQPPWLEKIAHRRVCGADIAASSLLRLGHEHHLQRLSTTPRLLPMRASHRSEGGAVKPVAACPTRREAIAAAFSLQTCAAADGRTPRREHPPWLGSERCHRGRQSRPLYNVAAAWVKRDPEQAHGTARFLSPRFGLLCVLSWPNGIAAPFSRVRFGRGDCSTPGTRWCPPTRPLPSGCQTSGTGRQEMRTLPQRRQSAHLTTPSP